MEIYSRGGKRPGAGRPKGTGKFGEPTVLVRVPETMRCRVDDVIKARGWRTPLVDMAAINRKRSQDACAKTPST